MSFDTLEALRSDIKKCVRCSLCKLVPLPTIQQTRFTSACPPVDEYHFHAFSGGGIQVMALALLDGRITIDSDLVKIVSACTTCGACDVACKFIMAAERQDVILALKAAIMESGFGPSVKVKKHQTAVHWADGLNLKRLPESRADVLLYAGGGASEDPLHASSARKLAALLKHARVDFGILAGEEPESGIEAHWTGQQTAFINLAQKTTAQLEESGAKVIVTLCGEDLGMLRSKYRRLNVAPRNRVLHASEFLLSLINKGRLLLRRPNSRRTTYHDPCYLGRQSEPPQDWQGEEQLTHGVMRYFTPPKPINYGTKGVFDAPRMVLQAIPGLSFIEMHRIREYAYCCGGGGGVPDAHPNVASTAARQRLEEARSIGAETVVTACQHCRRNLIQWMDGSPINVMDLVDLVYEAARVE